MPAYRLSAVIPYFAYAREDVRKHPGEPRSAQLAARLLATAGIECVITLELHSGALEHIRAAGVRSIVTTDSVRAVTQPGVEVVSTAPLFARAL